MTTDEVALGRGPERPPPSRHRRTFVMAGIVLAFLVVIAVVGALRGGSGPTPRPSSSSTGATGGSTGPALQLSGGRCAEQGGDQLVLGVGVTNHGTGPLTVDRLTPAFPMGGFTVATTSPAAPSGCSPAPTRLPARVPPGATATLLLPVLVAADPGCLAPLPVQVTFSYTVDGGGRTAQTLPAFPDLGGLGLPSLCGPTAPATS